MLELELAELIYKGIDPRTGELLNSPRDPNLDMRRAAYLKALRRMVLPDKPRRPRNSTATSNELETSEAKLRPAKQGTRWTEADDQLLREMWHSADAPTLERIATHFERQVGGISSRLVRLGICEDRETARQVSQLREARN